MTKSEARRRLRAELAALYTTSEDAGRVAQDAGLDLTYISLSTKAINNWHNILLEAEKRDLVDAVVQVAREEFPRSGTLATAYADYQNAHDVSSEPPEMEDTEPDMNITVLADLLRAAFTADDLRRFCLYRPRFRPVLDGVGARPSLNDLVDALIEFSQTRGLLDELLHNVKEERPAQYNRFEHQLFQK